MSGALPHAYPFRFVDSVLENVPKAAVGGTAGAAEWKGKVKTRLSANARATANGTLGSPMLYVEAIAQAALLLEGGDADLGRHGFLAGIDAFQILRPAEAGETLDISVQLAARFGGIVKFDGEVRSNDELLARGSVLVRKGDR
jgi:3-hydroxymyristoyl/3-hydroxydecanoyl-(acyl carrier protein) dehydratase